MPVSVDPDAYEGLVVLRSLPDFDFNVDSETPETVLVRKWKEAGAFCERHATLHLTAEWMYGNPMGLFFKAMREGIVATGPLPVKQAVKKREHYRPDHPGRGYDMSRRARPRGRS